MKSATASTIDMRVNTYIECKLEKPDSFKFWKDSEDFLESAVNFTSTVLSISLKSSSTTFLSLLPLLCTGEGVRDLLTGVRVRDLLLERFTVVGVRFRTRDGIVNNCLNCCVAVTQAGYYVLRKSYSFCVQSEIRSHSHAYSHII